MSTINLTQKIVAGLQHSDNQSVPDNEAFTYKVLFLNHVVPDLTNVRYFPAIIIDDEHADLFVKRKLTKHQLTKIYDGEGHVLVGKSCFVNCMKYDSVDWRKVNKNIDSIMDLANNIKESEVIQAPTLFPLEKNKYQVLTGHRRFFALIYTKGNHAPTQFKVYEHPPLLQKIKQFQENASREDLPQYGKLCAFNEAKMEIEALSQANKILGRKAVSVRQTVSILGISMGNYDNFNVLTRYPSVINAYEGGLSFPFVKTKKIVLQIEQQYRIANDKSVLNVTDKRTIDQQIKQAISNDATSTPSPAVFKFKPVKSGNTIRTLLESNIMGLETGIDWDAINWEDADAVSGAMNKVIEFLEQ